MDPPSDLHLERERGLTVEWADGTTTFYPVAYLRRMSPSAEARELRERESSDPLTVLPSRGTSGSAPLTAVEAELVGNYAIRIRFSDGHHTGLYSWAYLRSLDPPSEEAGGGSGAQGGPG